MNKILFPFLLLAFSANGADVVLSARGSEETIIPQNAYQSMKMSEKMITEQMLPMLATQLYMKQKSIGVADPEMANILGQTLFLDSVDECTLAIDLHFDPSTAPAGQGRGLWIATDKANFPLAKKILDNFRKNRGTVHSTEPLEIKELELSEANCPAMYINLDTNVKGNEKLWFVHPQSVMYYSEKLASAIADSI